MTSHCGWLSSASATPCGLPAWSRPPSWRITWCVTGCRRPSCSRRGCGIGRPWRSYTSFYTALAAFDPVDVAIAHARRAIQLEEFGAGWGVPQLFTRLGSGSLFERKSTPPQPATTKPRLNLRSVLTRSRPG